MAAEKFWIEFLLTNIKQYGPEHGYNLHESGGLPPSQKGISHSPESRAKTSKANKGKKRTEKQKANISNGKRGKKATAKTRKILSDAHKGKTLSEETKQKVSANNGRGMLGKHHTDATKLLLSEGSKGEHRSPTTEFKKGNKINQRLTPFEEEEIARLWLLGVSKRALARQFNIAKTSIARITKDLTRTIV